MKAEVEKVKPELTRDEAVPELAKVLKRMKPEDLVDTDNLIQDALLYILGSYEKGQQASEKTS